MRNETPEQTHARVQATAEAMREAIRLNQPRTAAEWAETFRCTRNAIYSITRSFGLRDAVRRPTYRRRETPTLAINRNGLGREYDRFFFRIGKLDLESAGLIGKRIAVTIESGQIILKAA